MKKLIKLESSVELSCCEYADKHDISNIKIKKRGWPDRLFFITNGYCFYVEFKRINKSAEKMQSHVHENLRSSGFHVYICKTRQGFKDILLYEIIESKSKKFKELEIELYTT